MHRFEKAVCTVTCLVNTAFHAKKLISFFNIALQFFSGTHAIACALFALLRPGDEVCLPVSFACIKNEMENN